MVYLGIIALLLVLIAANFVYSLRLAFTMSRDANGGGYPILAHAIHNFLMLLCAVILLPLVGEVPKWVTLVAILSLVAVPAANVWMIGRCARLGELRCKGRA